MKKMTKQQIKETMAPRPKPKDGKKKKTGKC